MVDWEMKVRMKLYQTPAVLLRMCLVLEFAILFQMRCKRCTDSMECLPGNFLTILFQEYLKVVQSSCEHGFTWDDRDPVECGWLVGNATIYTDSMSMMHIYEDDIFHPIKASYGRSRTVGSCQCKLQYDGQSDLLFNLEPLFFSNTNVREVFDIVVNTRLEILQMDSLKLSTCSHLPMEKVTGHNLPIIKPKCVADYNSWIGGVNLTDQQLVLQSICPNETDSEMVPQGGY